MIKTKLQQGSVNTNSSYDSSSGLLGSNVSSQDIDYNALYRGFNRTLSMDTMRINRIFPRLETFFKKNFLKEKDVQPANINETKGVKHTDNKNNLTQHRGGLHEDAKETILVSRRKQMDRVRGSKQSRSTRPELGTGGNASPSRLAATAVKYRRVKPDKSFGTVRYEIAKGGSITNTLVFRTTSKEETVKAKNLLNRDGVYRDPWVSHVLSSILSIPLQNSLGKDWITVRPEDVALEDSKAVRRFTSVDRRISRLVWILFVQCGSSAVKRLTGFLEPDQQEKSNPLDPSFAVEQLSKDTNSGFPLFVKKNSKVAIANVIKTLDTYMRHPSLQKLVGGNLSEVRDFEDTFVLDGFSYVQVIFHRLQLSVDDINQKVKVKIRQVWCVPFFVVALEFMYFKPILDKVKDVCLNSDKPLYTTGMNSVDISEKVVTRLRKRQLHTKGTGKFISQGDYSKFDQTIPSEFGWIFFRLHGELINMTRREKIVYEYLRFYFKYSPFVYKSELHVKSKGVSSGSYLTNYYDTFVNVTLILATRTICENISNDTKRLILSGKSYGWDIDYLMTKVDPNYKVTDYSDFATCGDDLLWVTDSLQNRIMQILCESIGMSINFSDPKTFLDDNIYFLGKYWDSKNQPWQTELYLVSHSLFRTKFYDKSNVQFIDEIELEIYRVLSIYTPFVNGWDMLTKHYGRWPRFIKFIHGKKDFRLLKGWPYDHYPKVSIAESKDWRFTSL